MIEASENPSSTTREQPESIGAVASALSAGWRALRSRPGATLAYGAPLFLAVAGAWVFAGVAIAANSGLPQNAQLDGGVVVWVGLASALFALILALVALLLATGYAQVWLLVVRGEPTGPRAFLIGFRRLPAVAVAGSISVAISLGTTVLGVLANALILALGANVFGRILPAGAAAAALVTALLSAVSAAILSLSAIVAVYVLVGIGLWPFLVTDAGLGGVAAVRTSWTMARGNRLILTSLLFATCALWSVGLAMFGVGLVLTLSVALASQAAMYDRLADGNTGAAELKPSRRVTLASVAVDAVLATWLVAGVWIIVLGASTAPIVDWVKEEWPPYGTRLLLLPTLLPGVVTLLIYAVYGALRGWPGRRIVGPGWGRFGWLAVGLLPLPLALGGPVSAARTASSGINALAVGQEMGRVVTAELPAGYERSLDQGGSPDWFNKMDMDDEQLTGAVSVYYTITDPAGMPYYFRLATYTQEETAQGASRRLAGPSGALRSTVIAPDDVPPALARRVALVGGTVLAGEGPAGRHAELETLTRLQAARIETAREHVAPVYEKLPKSVSPSNE